MADAATAPVGHNLPPPLDFEEILRPDLLRLQLEAQHGDLATRRDELLSATARFEAAYGELGIQDDETLGKASDFHRQLTAFAKKVEGTRETVKEPFNEAGKVVQAFFKASILDKIDGAARAVNAKRTAYLQQKEAQARAERLAAQRLAEEKARQAAEALERSATLETVEKAIETQQIADDAAAAAKAKPAELARTTSDLGVTTSLRRTLAFKVIDKAKVPLHLMQVVDAAVLQQGRMAKNPVEEQPVPGVQFYFETSAR